MSIGIIVRGKRPYGRIERFSGTCVLTTFGHVWWLPIVPHGSYVLSTGVLEEPATIPIGRHWGSILAAYIRTWGAFWLAVCVIAAATGGREFVLSGVPIWIDLAVLVVLVAVGWLRVGRIDRTEAAQRRVYAKFAGIAVDVMRLSRAQSADLRGRLRAVLSEEGRALASTYRDRPDPAENWQEVAIDPAVTKIQYLEAALTLARLESHRVVPSEGPTLRNIHEQVWRKIVDQGASP